MVWEIMPAQPDNPFHFDKPWLVELWNCSAASGVIGISVDDTCTGRWTLPLTPAASTFLLLWLVCRLNWILNSQPSACGSNATHATAPFTQRAAHCSILKRIVLRPASAAISRSKPTGW